MTRAYIRENEFLRIYPLRSFAMPCFFGSQMTSYFSCTRTQYVIHICTRWCDIKRVSRNHTLTCARKIWRHLWPKKTGHGETPKGVWRGHAFSRHMPGSFDYGYVFTTLSQMHPQPQTPCEGSGKLPRGVKKTFSCTIPLFGSKIKHVCYSGSVPATCT